MTNSDAHSSCADDPCAEGKWEITVRLFEAINASNDLHDLMKAVTGLLRDWIDCEAIGIRLRDGEDFPYFESSGFPVTFLEKENRLCAYDAQGRSLCDNDGKPVLECMCGNVLCGRFDPSRPFFTAHGSFWSNSTTLFLANATDADRQSLTRGRCIRAGYESLALIPLCAANEVFGLLQLNDHRPNRFSPGKIALFERLADSIAIALSQRQLQQALRKSEEKYRVLFDSAGDAIFIYNAESRMLAVNAAACERFGYTRDELMSMTVGQMESPEESSNAVDRINRSMTQDQLLFETVHRRKNGSRIPTEVNARRITWNGQPAVMCICRDITDRKRAESVMSARLRLSECAAKCNLDQLLQKTLDEAEILTGSEIGFFHFVEADQKTLLLQTWSTNTLRKHCAAEGKGSHYDVDLAGVWVDCLRQRRPVIHNDYMALPHRKGLPPGHAKVVRELVVPLICGDRIVAVLGVGNKPGNYDNRDADLLMAMATLAWDIVQRKRAEEAREKLETQNRQLQKSESLGRMAGAIAHHFNNQLQVVMMNLEFAMRRQASGVAPIENLNGAMQSARKAAEVSTLMLTYLGQSVAKMEPLDISDSCRQSLPILRAAMPKGVVLETDLASPGPTIVADANLIQQVLTNLATNAWEAGGDGHNAIRLTVKSVAAADIPAANRFPIDCQAADSSYACLEVADSGCGIADKDIEKLFDPFFSSKFIGRGLGLSVVLGIVRAHRGLVTVESEAGRGSVFRVFLPVSAQAAPKKPVPESQALNAMGSGTVLVVDDETSLRKVVTTAIKSMGFTVLGAQDGIEAVELFLLHKDAIRLVLCDLTMPRMDGWQTLSALRKIAPDIPVILASGYSEAQAMAGSHPELPQAFLSKPYEYEALSEAVFRVLNRIPKG
jgi:PAS domain S-box-containing protein